MSRNNRVTAPRPGAQVFEDRANNQYLFEPILSNMMEKSFPKKVDPSCCIPLYLIRQRSTNAIQRLMYMFDGKTDNYILPGIVSGTPSSIVVPLTGELAKIAHEYFSSEGKSKEDIDEIMSKHELWYGIIDGCQFHGAIMKLREQNTLKWMQFEWRVVVVESVWTMGEYRQLARIQNERNKETYHHESTVYELLHGLRIEYDLLYDKAFK